MKPAEKEAKIWTTMENTSEKNGPQIGAAKNYFNLKNTKTEILSYFPQSFNSCPKIDKFDKFAHCGNHFN